MTIKEIHEYCEQLKGSRASYKEEWDAFLFLLEKKFFALMGEDKEKNSMISLKCDPIKAEELRAAFPEDIIPGYFLNKTHWNSVRIPSKVVSDQLMRQMIDDSYNLVLSSFSKKKQKEIVGEA